MGTYIRLKLTELGNLPALHFFYMYQLVVLLSFKGGVQIWVIIK